MAKTLKILSWNLKKFGDRKLNEQNVIDFICRVITNTNADVVGLMEVVGWIGNQTRDKLVAVLNQTGIEWWGESSEMSSATREVDFSEQYIFLWKKRVLNVDYWQLWNVFGETDFDPFFQKFRYEKDKQKEFWASLRTNDWLDESYRLKFDRRAELKDYKKFKLDKEPPSFGLDDDQKKEIVGILLKEQPVYFPYVESRPPFLLYGKADDIDITFVLYHAPSPGRNECHIASNQLSFLRPVQDARVCVVMGDFNVNLHDSRKKDFKLIFVNTDAEEIKFEFVIDRNTQRPVECSLFQRLTGPIFSCDVVDPKLIKVLNYGALLSDNAKTTIKTNPVDEAMEVSEDNIHDYILLSEYDKFFVCPDCVGGSSAEVYQAIDAMAPRTEDDPSPSYPRGRKRKRGEIKIGTEYDGHLTASALAAYNKRCEYYHEPTIEKSIDHLSLEDVRKIYLTAISDHLPIIMTLEYGQ